MSTRSKLPDVGTSIFTVMSQLAQSCGAINLAQGFPSFNPPDDLLDLVAHYVASGANQYAPSNGVPSFLEAIAEKIDTEYGYRPNADSDLTVCTGATEGMFSAILALVNKDDEIVVLDPAYDAYEPAIRLAGGKPLNVPLRIVDGEFEMDWEALQSALKPTTRAIILNFPHNPTGALLSDQDLHQLAELLRSSKTLVISDEVYEHIVFDGRQHASLLGHDELRQRSVVVSSFGKTFHATGWKIGYVCAPPELTTEFRKVHQFATFSVNTPVQHALADFMQANPNYYADLVDFYAGKRDFFVQLLARSQLQLTPTRSTFFQLVDYSAVSERPDVDMAVYLTKEIGVAAIPLSVFCKEDLTGRRLRLCFAKNDTELEDAAERLAAL